MMGKTSRVPAITYVPRISKARLSNVGRMVIVSCRNLHQSICQIKKQAGCVPVKCGELRCC